jgi:hypothetical protein
MELRHSDPNPEEGDKGGGQMVEVLVDQRVIDQGESAREQRRELAVAAVVLWIEKERRELEDALREYEAEVADAGERPADSLSGAGG